MGFWNFIGGFALFSFICSLFSGTSSNRSSVNNSGEPFRNHNIQNEWDEFDDPYAYFDEYDECDDW